MVRKYAFHMVMAGHRFNKAGQVIFNLNLLMMSLEMFILCIIITTVFSPV